jgi:hypothetical protein
MTHLVGLAMLQVTVALPAEPPDGSPRPAGRLTAYLSPRL